MHVACVCAVVAVPRLSPICADGRPLAGIPPVVSDMTMQLPKGSTCLLVGPNGAGKTTLLKILGGKHMVPKTAVTVLGQPPFHATGMSAAGQLSYLGGNWDRDIAFAGYSVPLQVIRQSGKTHSCECCIEDSAEVDTLCMPASSMCLPQCS